jgi:hypothetical protein
MAEQIFKGIKVFAGAYDLSGDANKIAMEDGGTGLDTTTFAHTARRQRAGLPSPSVKGEGFVTFGTGEVDSVLKSYLGLDGVPITVCPQNNTPGTVACFIPATVGGMYQTGTEVGKALPFNFSAESQGQPLVNGFLFVGAGVKSANDVSIGIQLGAVAAGRKLHAVLHVLSADGDTPTLDVIVESDSANTFGSATTVLTFGQKTDAGYEAVSNSSVQTDTWYRVSYELDGDSPEFSFVVAIGIY